MPKGLGYGGKTPKKKKTPKPKKVPKPKKKK